MVSVTQFKANDIDDVTRLFTEYSKELGIDLSYQNFEEEVASLPGKYSKAQGGDLLIARNEQGTAIGCVCLRKLPYMKKEAVMDSSESMDGYCEMKRLYVSPQGRGLKVGKALTQSIIQSAIQLGYKYLLLDTLVTMDSAKSIYRQLGFIEIAPYYDTPVKGTTFLKLDLSTFP